MLHFCVFGGHSGELAPGRRVFFTLFGACELKRQTLAKQVLEMRARGGGVQRQPRGQHVFITVFGGTELKAPTLAEEFIDLQDALTSGLIKPEEWDWAVTQLASSESHSVGSFTLFGAFEASTLPTEEEELDAMALSNYVGRVSETAVQMLRLGVGQTGSNRSAVVRQAVAAARLGTA